jgi:hypothetical protein
LRALVFAGFIHAACGKKQAKTKGHKKKTTPTGYSGQNRHENLTPGWTGIGGAAKTRTAFIMVDNNVFLSARQATNTKFPKGVCI